MKKLITLLLLIASSNLFAQTDSFEVKETKLVKAYNFLTMAKKEERKVWKVDAFPSILVNLRGSRQSYYFQTSISFEKKVTPKFSYCIQGGIDIYQSSIFSTSNGSNTTYEYNPTYFNIPLSLELKYYYNIGKRMHKHHSANNFSASYFALRYSRMMYYSTVYSTQSGGWENEDEKPVYSNSPYFTEFHRGPFNCNYVSIYHGFQRRFLKVGYFDLQTGFMYRYTNSYNRNSTYVLYKPNSLEKLSRILPSLNIKLGFAF